MTLTREATDALDPVFSGSVEQLAALSVTPAAGLLIGRTRGRRPVRVTLLRPQPSDIVVLGDTWVASLLVLRAAVLGATVVIVTDRPDPWHQLVQRVGGAYPFASVLGRDARAMPSPSVAAPVLVLRDGPVGTGFDDVRTPWRTSVQLARGVAECDPSMLRSSELTLVTRPDPIDRTATKQTLNLLESQAAQLDRMGPTEVLALTRQHAVLVAVEPTPTEVSLLSTR